MLYQIQLPEFKNQLKKNEEVEYAIYIFDHLRRIYESKYGHIGYYLNYEQADNKLIEPRPGLLAFNHLSLYRKFMQKFFFKKILSKKNADKDFDLLKLYFEESKNELQKTYPNIKFMIIKYPFGSGGKAEGLDYYQEYLYHTPSRKELEDEGFMVIDLKDYINVDLTSKECTVPDGHPNSKAWDIITRKLVKDYNL